MAIREFRLMSDRGGMVCHTTVAGDQDVTRARSWILNQKTFWDNYLKTELKIVEVETGR